MQDFDRNVQRKTGDPTRSQHMAYHMHFSIRDMARIGLLMSRDGSWNGQQVVPRAWAQKIRSLVTPMNEMNPPGYRALGSGQRWGYGFMWWVWDAATRRGRSRTRTPAWGPAGSSSPSCPNSTWSSPTRPTRARCRPGKASGGDPSPATVRRHPPDAHVRAPRLRDRPLKEVPETIRTTGRGQAPRSPSWCNACRNRAFAGRCPDRCSGRRGILSVRKRSPADRGQDRRRPAMARRAAESTAARRGGRTSAWAWRELHLSVGGQSARRRLTEAAPARPGWLAAAPAPAQAAC